MHLYFCLIDPERNKFRSYSIAEQLTLYGAPDLVITWGRIGARQRRRDEHFSSAAELTRRKRELLSRRQRHGYTMLGSSALPAGPHRE